jgi:transcriptional regulator with XRE-family HTH domain
MPFDITTDVLEQHMAKETGGRADPVARRIRLLRKALGYDTAAGFAAAIGWESNRLTNFENGLPLSKDAAITLCQRVDGLSLDWLYFGKTDALSVSLAKRLSAAEKQERPQGTPGANSRRL